MEELMNNVVSENQIDGVAAPVLVEPEVKIDIPVAEPKLTKGEKVAVGVTIGLAATAVAEAAVIIVLAKRNGGFKEAFRKKDVDEEDFDDFEDYEDYEELEKPEVVDVEEVKKEKK